MSNQLGIKSSLMRLSQGQLNLLETCPPQFQRIYLEQLASPITPEQQEKQTWGTQFHLLMQQRELGLPIEPLLREDEQLHHSINSLLQAAPEIWQQDTQTWREAEHCRTLNFQGYLFTVIYDLLISDRSFAQIIDWKTYLQPQDGTKLAQNWQTRLYLYILAETSEYLPEQISMTYWFVKLPTQPQSITFTYNSAKHEQTRQNLTSLVTQLKQYLEDYQREGIPFPHRPNCQASCPYYQSWLTEKKTSIDRDKNVERDWLTSIAEIEEVTL